MVLILIEVLSNGTSKAERKWKYNWLGVVDESSKKSIWKINCYSEKVYDKRAIFAGHECMSLKQAHLI